MGALFGRLEADQRKVCELQRLGTTPHLSTLGLCSVYLTSSHITKSPWHSTFVFADTASDQKLEQGSLGMRLWIQFHGRTHFRPNRTMRPLQ